MQVRCIECRGRPMADIRKGTQMNSLVAELIAGIESNDEEAFIGAAMVAESLSMTNAAPISPYDELLKANPPTPADGEALKRALTAYVQSNNSRLGRAIFALGKFYDPALVPLFREHLAAELKTLLDHNGVLASLIIALDNAGEKIIINGSQSPMEVDNSIAAARQYLKQFGQVFPW